MSDKVEPPSGKKKHHPAAIGCASVIWIFLILGALVWMFGSPTPETTARRDVPDTINQSVVPPIVIDPKQIRWKQTEAHARLYLTPCAETNRVAQAECLDTQRHFIFDFVQAMAGDWISQSAVAGHFMAAQPGISKPAIGAPTNAVETCAWTKYVMRGATEAATHYAAEAMCEPLSTFGKAEALARTSAIAKAVSPANKPPPNWQPVVTGASRS